MADPLAALREHRDGKCGVKASDITDEAFLAAIDEACRVRTEVEGGNPWTSATRWDVAAVLAGHPEHVGGPPQEYPNMPEKVVLAKAKRLIRRGLVDGCACGCRGDFERPGTTAALVDHMRRQRA
jgi:hypothetical protein